MNPNRTKEQAKRGELLSTFMEEDGVWEALVSLKDYITNASSIHVPLEYLNLDLDWSEAALTVGVAARQIISTCSNVRAPSINNLKGLV